MQTPSNEESGYLVKKVLTVNGNGATLANLFTLTGSVEAEIWGEVTSKTDSTTCSTCYFDLYDSTAAVVITKATGVDMSGCIVGDIISKDALATSAAVKTSCAVGAVVDGVTVGTKRLQMPFRVTKKTGAATSLRFAYTGDATTNLQITFYCRYVPLTSDGKVVAA